jgi:hypothetical protein
MLMVRGSNPVNLREVVRLDGKEYPSLEGSQRLAAWTKLDDSLYRQVIKKDESTDTVRWAISDEGRKLAQENTSHRTSGSTDVMTRYYERTSGDPKSLLGTWKFVSSKANSSKPFTLTLRLTESGELQQVVDGVVRHSATLDGKPSPVTGGDTLPHLTRSLHSVGERKLRTRNYLKGTPFYHNAWTLSADGKTLTVEQFVGDAETEPRAQVVYERQR